MKKFIFLIFGIVLFSGCSVAQQPNKVLVFGKTSGYYHTSIPHGMAVLKEICAKQNIIADTTRDANVFTTDNLKQYKAVVFINTTGTIFNDQQREAFTQFIRNGGGFVGIHAATDTEYDWEWYGKLVGARFMSHPHQQEATICVQNKNNPATDFLPDKWQHHDEWYDFKQINPAITVLATLDENSYEGGKMGSNHPFIWCHEFEGGRAFYTGVGHNDNCFDEPLVQRHLLEAICWAGRLY